MAGKTRQRLKKSATKKSSAGSRRRVLAVPQCRARHRQTEAGSQGEPTRSTPRNDSKKTAPRPATQRTERPAIAVVEQRPAVKATQRHGFKINEYIVYPAHGVGQILAIEEQEVAGYKLELFVINFIKDKMTLRVPVTKIASVGMRKLAEGGLVKRALETLKGRARIKRTMWSRRAQEYEAKINSGDIVRSPRSCATSFAPTPSRSRAIPSASSMRRRSTGCRAKSRRCSAAPRPRRSRRSKARSPRVRAAVRSPPGEEAVVEDEAA